MIEDEHLHNAVKRIALTPDGRLLHLLLQRAIMATAPSVEAGALQTFEGGRRFAADLKRLMDLSIAETTSDRTGEPSSERPIVVASPGAVSSRASSGARRRGGIGEPAGR